MNTTTPELEYIEAVVEAKMATVDFQEEVMSLAAEKVATRLVEAVETAKAVQGRTLVLTGPKGAAKAKVEGAHIQLPELIMVLELGLHVWLHGPAGTGKTTAARHAADALSLPFYAISFCSATPLSSLVGYMNAAGEYVSTCYRKAYETGGIFLADEIDAANPNILAVLNMGLDAPVMAFPDGMVKRHPDFLCVGAANTVGAGSFEYAARNTIDRATIDRFAFICWNEDPAIWATCDKAWVALVDKARAQAFTMKLAHYIGPRAYIQGSPIYKKLGASRAVDMTIIKGMDPDQASTFKTSLLGQMKVKK